MYAEDLLSGARQLGTRGRFILVALNAQGKPTGVPRFIAES
jgi:acyl-CoA hydrolase